MLRNGGILGKAALDGSGVDVEAESKRGGMLDKQQREMLKKRRAGLESLLSQAEQSGGSAVDESGIELSSDQIRKFIDDTNEALGIQVKSFVDSAKDNAGEQLAGVEESLREKLDGIDKEFQSSADASREAFDKQTRGGSSAADSEIGDLRSELESLYSLAETQREESARKRKLATESAGGVPTEEELTAGNKQKIFGSFSAAAALVQGQGQNPVVKHLKSLEERLAELVGLDKEQTRISQKTSDQILTAMIVA